MAVDLLRSNSFGLLQKSRDEWELADHLLCELLEAGLEEIGDCHEIDFVPTEALDSIWDDANSLVEAEAEEVVPEGLGFWA